MKRVLTGLMAVIMLLTVTACGNTDNKVNEADRYTTMVDNSNSTNDSTSASIDKIKIVTPDGNIIIKLDDNKAADDLFNMLPMTVKFEDFNKTEKISYIKGRLDTSDAITEYAPEAGTFAYYIPWGNLSLFYEPFTQSSELAELGVVESGMEYVRNIDKYDSVTIEQDR